MAKMKELPKVERPREKMEKYGPEKLSNPELLAVILRTGTKGMNVVELSRKIIKKFNNGNLASASFDELKNTFGLGKAKAAEIMACFELGRRLLKDKKTELIMSPHDVWENLRDVRDNKKEHFVIFFLDTRNQQIQREVISVGTLNANLVHPREVFEPAIRCSAAQIIVAHNHPSGDASPSDDDIQVTKRLVEAGKILGIEMLDHVVVCQNSFSSLKCEDLL